MPPCDNKSANNPLERDTKIIPLEQIFMALRDIKSYGELPFVSSGAYPSHPMISSGIEIKILCVINSYKIKSSVLVLILVVYKTL
jgi:hypothetical protein